MGTHLNLWPNDGNRQDEGDASTLNELDIGFVRKLMHTICLEYALVHATKDCESRPTCLLGAIDATGMTLT